MEQGIGGIAISAQKTKNCKNFAAHQNQIKDLPCLQCGVSRNGWPACQPRRHACGNARVGWQTAARAREGNRTRRGEKIAILIIIIIRIFVQASRRALPGSNAFEGLPVEVLLEVLSLLSPRDLAAVRLVDRRCCDLASDRSLYRDLAIASSRLDDVDSENAQRWLEATMKRVSHAKHLEAVERLTISAGIGQRLAASELATLARHMGALTSLDARHLLRPLTAAHVHALPGDLRALNLGEISADDAMTECGALGCLSRLECLAVEYVDQPSVQLPLAAFVGLRRLSLRYSTDVDLEHLVETLANDCACAATLEALDLTGADGWYGTWWQTLPALTALVELGCTIDPDPEASLAGEAMIGAMASALGSLRVLEVDLQAASAETLVAFVSGVIGGLARLRALALWCMVDVPQFASAFPPGLVHLYMFSGTCDAAFAGSLLGACPDLATLVVKTFTDSGVTALAAAASPTGDGRRLCLYERHRDDGARLEALRCAGHAIDDAVVVGVGWRIAGGISRDKLHR